MISSITKQEKIPSTLCWVLALAAMITAFINGLLIARYPPVIYLLPIALVTIVFLLALDRRTDQGLLIAILLVVVQRSPALPFVGNLLTISEVVFVLTALVWLVQNARQRRKVEVHAPGLLGPFFIYLLVAVVSLMDGVTQNIESGVSELLARVYLMLFLVVVSTYTTTADQYRRVLFAWLGSAYFVVVLTLLYLYFRGTGYDPIGLAQDRVMFRALYKYSTGLAGYLAGTFLGFLPLALSRWSIGGFHRVRRLARWCLPGLLVALVLTDSQAAFFGVAAGVLAWPFIRLARFLSPILVVLILVVSSLALVSVLELQSTDGFLTRALAVTGYPYDNLSGRMALLETRFGAIADHPLTGVGLGQIGKYVDYMTGTDSGIVSHFTPIGILAETGVLGLLAVSFILIAFLRIMWGNAALNLANNSGWLQLNEGLTMAFIGIMVFGLAHDIQTNRTLWLVLALIVSLKPACLSDER